MDRRSRLMATLRGETVDRPAVSFYEINGLDEDPHDPDPFNIYAHPSWKPLIDLAGEKTDRIVMRGVPFMDEPVDLLEERSSVETFVDSAGSRVQTRIVRCDDRVLTARSRRDPDVNTTWQIEHLLKSVDDLKAYLRLPELTFGGVPDTAGVLATEKQLGDSGIVMIDTPDPLCVAAELFHMSEYTIIASTEPILFRRLLDRIAAVLLQRTAAIAKALPGRLWRIFGPEYASPPFLPPRLFTDYVTAYDRLMVESIQAEGGFARIHCHGNIRDILDDIAATGCVGLDPIEPPPQGNVSLRYVRERVGRQMVLFGNLEASDIEFLPTDQFAARCRSRSTKAQPAPGVASCCMPSSCPYGRELPIQALRNYEAMVEAVERF